jgi:predicted glycoside hydrolase/deacetylase ChbG (UPF0249 family)
VKAAANDADRALAVLREHPDVNVGVHLTLTGGGPAVLPGSDVPGLYNERETMWATVEQAVAHTTPEEAAREWEAQIRKVLDAGIEITHLDSHMGCYFADRRFFRAAFDLAKRYRVPLIAPYIPPYSEPGERELFPVAAYEGIYDLGGAEETLENRTEAYRRLFSRLGPGTSYIFTHHGSPAGDRSELGDLVSRSERCRAGGPS